MLVRQFCHIFRTANADYPFAAHGAVPQTLRPTQHYTRRTTAHTLRAWDASWVVHDFARLLSYSRLPRLRQETEGRYEPAATHPKLRDVSLRSSSWSRAVSVRTIICGGRYRGGRYRAQEVTLRRGGGGDCGRRLLVAHRSNDVALLTVQLEWEPSE
jgi:hypothetical protein